MHYRWQIFFRQFIVHTSLLISPDEPHCTRPPYPIVNALAESNPNRFTERMNGTYPLFTRPVFSVKTGTAAYTASRGASNTSQP